MGSRGRSESPAPEQEVDGDPTDAFSVDPDAFEDNEPRTLVTPATSLAEALGIESEAAERQSRSGRVGGLVERKLRLPLPGEAASPAQVPMPEISGSAPITAPPPPTTPMEVRGASSMSRSAASGPAAHPPDSDRSLSQRATFDALSLNERPLESAETPSKWTEYKEVIRALSIGSVLMGLGIIFQIQRNASDPGTALASRPIHDQDSQSAESRPEPPPAPEPSRPAQSTSPIRGDTEPPPRMPSAPVKSSTPMVTVVSSPSGAMVEIDGVVLGKTPLVRPCPANIGMLKVRLSLDAHRVWEKQVSPGPTGHFTINASLEPNHKR